MQVSRATALLAAIKPRQLVRLQRRFEEGHVRGYVLGVGPAFFLVALVSDQLWHDGFECFRLTDLVSVEPDPYAQFAETALKRRGLRRPKMPKVELDSIASILVSAGIAFPLITLHSEAKDPDICQIGRVLAVDKTQVALLEIGPDAVWDEEPTVHALRSITRVSFGGDYEDALFLVGGAGAA
jgi:hypothetical protein